MAYTYEEFLREADEIGIHLLDFDLFQDTDAQIEALRTSRVP